jgi:hypothetical protein
VSVLLAFFTAVVTGKIKKECYNTIKHFVGDDKYMQCVSRETEEKIDHLVDLSLDGRIILK